MARRKQAEGAETTAVAPVSVELRPVQVEQPEAESIEVAGLPAEWQDATVLGGLPPSPVFEIPGEAIFGIYVGVRDGVGPNNSRVYEIMAHKGPNQKPELTAIWGSTALDRMFDSAMPKVKSGDKIGIVYLGERPTKRNQNPVKLFKLLVKAAGGPTTTMNSTKSDDVKAAKSPEVINAK